MPEHTFAAYDLAIEEGAGYIEQDVVASKDGTLYVSHDTSALRLFETNRLFADMTDDEVLQLTNNDGEPIRSLESILKRYGNRTGYTIEPKGSALLGDIANLVASHSLEDRTIVQSSNAYDLSRVKAKYPSLRTMLLCVSLNDVNAALSIPDIDIICMEQTLLSQSTVDSIHLHGKLAGAWVLNEVNEIEKAVELGVDIYFTDYPKRAIDIDDR